MPVVTDVDVTTLAFGPDEAPPAFDLTRPWMFRLSHRDLNGDGKTDLLSHFRAQETGIAVGDTEACVTGETKDGAPFRGCDSIAVVPECGLGAELILLLPPVMWLCGRGERARR